MTTHALRRTLYDPKERAEQFLIARHAGQHHARVHGHNVIEHVPTRLVRCETCGWERDYGGTK